MRGRNKAVGARLAHGAASHAWGRTAQPEGAPDRDTVDTRALLGITVWVPIEGVCSWVGVIRRPTSVCPRAGVATNTRGWRLRVGEGA